MVDGRIRNRCGFSYLALCNDACSLTPRYPTPSADPSGIPAAGPGQHRKLCHERDRLLPQIGKRVVALHPPLFHPQVDLQGTRRRIWKIISVKNATRLHSRRERLPKIDGTMSEKRFPRPQVSKLNGYIPPVVEPLNHRFHLLTCWQRHI